VVRIALQEAMLVGCAEPATPGVAAQTTDERSPVRISPARPRFAVSSLALLGTVFLSGCASVFYGPRQEVKFYSAPPGAKVKVTSRAGNERHDLVTPATIRLRRKYEYDVTFTKPGFQETRRMISKRINIWYILDYVYYVVPGLIDTAVGAGWILEPSQLDVTLAQATGAETVVRTPPSPGIRTAPPRVEVDVAKHPHRNATAAILTFDARAGVSADEVALLTDRFAVEIGRLEVYKLISRSKMKEVLEIQEYSITCASTECAVEAGQLLGVEYMVYGSIGRIGSLYTINIYITNVEKGSVVAGATVDYRGQIEGLLTVGMPQAVNNLLRAVMEKERPAGK